MSARTNRQRCWDNRDAYYMCLTKHSIVAPPGTDMSDIKGALGRGQFAEPPRTEAERVRLAAEERAHDPCTHERDAYEGSCAHSWVCFFLSCLRRLSISINAVCWMNAKRSFMQRPRLV